MEVVKSKYEKVRCIYCTTVGQWKNVDEFRYKPSGMCMCTNCGFVTYPDVISKTAKLTEFYREEYRDAPGVNNLYTGERKCHFHGAFLESLFKEWEASKVTEPAVCEIGAAFGMFLNWVRGVVPKAKLYGTELTTSMVRNAYHLYNLQFTDEIDTTLQYDLIASYKVAEHQPNVDLELQKYAKCLKPGGRLYISVPTWFNTLGNFGVNGFSIEYYYHKNHINVWTRGAFESLLNRCGFEIIQQNHTYYDNTYLCVVNEAVKKNPIVLQVPEVEAALASIWKAAKAFDCGDYAQALEAWPCFPDAHINHYESNRAKFNSEGFDWIMENVGKRALDACPKSHQALALNADICMRYNHWEKALEFLNKALDYRPNDAQALMNVAQCFRQLAGMMQGAERLRLTVEARNVTRLVTVVSQQAKPEALNWMMQDNARIPTPFEKGKAPAEVAQQPGA